MCGSRLPSASTSRCSSSAATAVDARQQRRHDDHRARVVRNADRRSRGASSRRGGIAQATTRWARAMAMSAAGMSSRSSERRERGGRGALVPRVRRAAGEQQRRSWRRSRRGRASVACGEDEAPDPLAEPRAVRDVGLEVAAALIDQVVADVGGAIGGRSAGRAPGGRSRPRAARPGPARRRSARRAPRPPAAADRG